LVSEELKKLFKFFRDMTKLGVNTVEAHRAGTNQMASMVKLPKDVKCESIDAGGVPAEWVTTPKSNDHNAILHLHGGYYIAGNVKLVRPLAAVFSRENNCRVLNLDYRLAPEFPFPAAIEDATAAYRWLIDNQNIDPNNIIIEGTSAGGGLTIACLLNLRDQGVSLPVAAVALCPYVDLALTGKSYEKNAEYDWISREMSEFCAPLYLNGVDPRNPLASPIYADFKGIPPLLIQVGGAEVLLDDSLRLVERARAAGVDVELDIWEDMVHGFQDFSPTAPECIGAVKKINEFIKKFFT